jgi:hypothetical protein
MINKCNESSGQNRLLRGFLNTLHMSNGEIPKALSYGFMEEVSPIDLQFL